MDNFAHERSGRLTESGLSVVAASGMAQRVTVGAVYHRPYYRRSAKRTRGSAQPQGIDCPYRSCKILASILIKSFRFRRAEIGKHWAIHEPNRHHTAGTLRHTRDDRGRRSRGDVVVYVYILLAR